MKSLIRRALVLQSSASTQKIGAVQGQLIVGPVSGTPQNTVLKGWIDVAFGSNSDFEPRRSNVRSSPNSRSAATAAGGPLVPRAEVRGLHEYVSGMSEPLLCEQYSSD